MINMDHKNKLKYPFFAVMPRHSNNGSVDWIDVLVTDSNYKAQSVYFTTMYGVSDMDFFASWQYMEIIKHYYNK